MRLRTVTCCALAALALVACGAGLPDSRAAPATHWVASWAASPSDPSPSQPTLADQTLRMIVAPHFAGTSLRVHLSNRFGHRPITLDRVDIGQQSNAATLVPGSNRPVTFAGATAVTIAPGRDAVSDPVALTVTPFHNLAVSVFIDHVIANPTEHRLTRQTSFLTPAGTGDHAGDASAGAFTRTTAGQFSTGWYFLDGIDVRAGSQVGTVVCLGDSITDGYQGRRLPGVEAKTGIDANARYPDALARRLLAAGAPLSVVNAGIGGNQLLKNGTNGGPSAIARLRKDVISQPGVRDVIVLEGINDIGSAGASVDQVNAGLKHVVAALHRAHLRVQLGTITPAVGTISSSGRYGTAAGNAIRNAVNTWIRRQRYSDGVIDFDRAVRDPASPGRLRPVYDGSDHLHLSVAGYKAMAAAVPLSLLR